MPNFNMLPLSGTLVNNITTALTTTGTSAAMTLPLAESYRFILEVHTVSGTSPTLDVWLETSADGGTNYVPFLQFAEVTTSGQGKEAIWKPYLGVGDSGTSMNAPLLGSVDGSTSSSTSCPSGPIDTRYIKVRSLLGGTTPSFAFAVRYIALAPQHAQ